MRMVLVGFVAIGMLLTVNRAGGQVSASFEVASVKPNTSGENTAKTSARDGSFTAKNALPSVLIAAAFNVKEFQLIGGPNWIRSEGFDVQGRSPAGQTFTPSMLKTLLEDRFSLVAHRDISEAPIYALIVGRTGSRLGPQIRPTTTVDCKAGRAAANPSGPLVGKCGFNGWIGDEGGRMTAVAQSMESLAAWLGHLGLGRHVVDQTGLHGRYDFDFQWSFDATVSRSERADGTPGVFTALREQLGLALKSQTGPVEFVVIDDIQRPTAD